MTVIGKPLPRIEDPPLLTGQGRFLADLQVPGMLHMRVVRAPVALGRLGEIDTVDAAAMPGVVAVWTAADIATLPPVDFRMTRIAGLEAYRQPLLARDFVRYVGEPVALVFADGAHAAEDAAEAVFCDIDEMAPRLDPADGPGAFPTTDEPLSGEPATVTKAYGDLDAAFAGAHAVIEVEARVGRHSGVPLETRGALAVPGEGETLVLHGAAKVPHYNRDAIARMLGRDPATIQLSEGHVGGGFGIRGELYPEDVLVCAAALRLGRPVKWVEDRREHLMAANHARDQRYRLRAAVDGDGFLRGLEAEFITDQGAYIRTHGGTVTDLSAAMLPGPYLIPAYRATGHIRLTNKTPAGTYRAPGRFESTFARERLMDAIARRLGHDPLAVRRRNLIPAASMPHDRGIDALGTPLVYDSGDYADLLDRAEAHFDLGGLRAEAAARRAAGEAVGVGVALFVEKSGLGPRDVVHLRVLDDGTVEAVTGVASIGQGVETVLAQIAAEELDLPITGIRVVHGQTARIGYGMGAFASRVTVMAGTAMQIAARTLRDRALAVAAEMLQSPPEALCLGGGTVIRPDSGATVSLAQIAAHAGDGLFSEGVFDADHMNYPYGVHIARVRVDRATCGVTVERYAVAYDVGRAVNPMLVEGQIVGAAAQGIGGALMEEFVYSPDGQPLAASLADYLMPSAAEMPAVEVLIREDAPSPQNPLGVKGAGEGGLTAAGAAIAAAIDDALARPGLVRALPVSPDRLHRWLQADRSRGDVPMRRCAPKTI